jgi:hypothetical protein
MRRLIVTIAASVVLTGCSGKVETFKRCSYEADIATASLLDNRQKRSRSTELLVRCMSASGFELTPGAADFFRTYGVLYVPDSTYWEGASERWFRSMGIRFP